MLLKMTIIFFMVVIWFSIYNIRKIEKESFIEEKDIIWESSELNMNGKWVIAEEYK